MPREMFRERRAQRGVQKEQCRESFGEVCSGLCGVGCVQREMCRERWAKEDAQRGMCKGERCSEGDAYRDKEGE